MSELPYERYLTLANPLGPVRHERIIEDYFERRASLNILNFLIYRVDVFDTLIPVIGPIILGRRGAGKTAVAAAIMSQNKYNKYFLDGNHEQIIKSKDDLYVFLNDWKNMDQMVQTIYLFYGEMTQGLPERDGEVSTNTVARFWERMIWRQIFNEIIEYCDREAPDFGFRSEISEYVDGLRDYLCGGDIVNIQQELTSDIIIENFDKAKNHARDIFSCLGIKCFVIMDSLDEYPCIQPRFKKILGGFIRCLHLLNDFDENLIVHACLPEELQFYLDDVTATSSTDMVPSRKFTKIKWSPHDLLRIVSWRYKKFLELHNKKTNGSIDESIEAINDLDLHDRTHVSKFFQTITVSKIENRFECEEYTLAYIVRHTQLIPRQIINIISEAIRLAWEKDKIVHIIQGEHIKQAVLNNERSVARELLVPYVNIFPTLSDIENLRKFFDGLPPIVNGERLFKCIKSFEQTLSGESETVLRSLFHMGVIGFIDQEETNKRKSKFYAYANFSHNYDGEIEIHKDINYCFHPIFSGALGLHRNRVDGMPYIYPARISEDFNE